jgi:hypothetical protein
VNRLRLIASLNATLCAAMAALTFAAGPISQTLAVARIDADQQPDSTRATEFKLVVLGSWDGKTAAPEKTSNKTEQKTKQQSLLRPLSDPWDTAKVIHFDDGLDSDVPDSPAVNHLSAVALIAPETAPPAVYARPHSPIRPGHAPPWLS